MFTPGLVREPMGSTFGRAIPSDFRSGVVHHKRELHKPAGTHVVWLAPSENLLSDVICSALDPFPRPQHRKRENRAEAGECAALLTCLGRVQVQYTLLFVISRALA